MTKKAVSLSLSSELHLIRRSLDAVGLLLQQWAELHFSEDEVRRVAPAAHATVVLLRERVGLLERVVRDTVDPRIVFADENRGEEPLPGDDDDIVLPAWSVGETRAKARDEASRAERRIRALKDRRRTKVRTRKGTGDP